MHIHSVLYLINIFIHTTLLIDQEQSKRDLKHYSPPPPPPSLARLPPGDITLNRESLTMFFYSWLTNKSRLQVTGGYLPDDSPGAMQLKCITTIDVQNGDSGTGESPSETQCHLELTETQGSLLRGESQIMKTHLWALRPRRCKQRLLEL